MVPETIVTNNHEILGLVEYSAIGPSSVIQATMQGCRSEKCFKIYGFHINVATLT